MIKVVAWASCVMLLLGCSGCSWIPWYGNQKSCDLNKYRLPAVASTSPTGSNLVRGNGPAVEVPETDFDFGKVGEDKLLIHDFRVRNVGNSVLKIKKILPS
jgi:hypothetical protein